jgi:hypothetical protein
VVNRVRGASKMNVVGVVGGKLELVRWVCFKSVAGEVAG